MDTSGKLWSRDNPPGAELRMVYADTLEQGRCQKRSKQPCGVFDVKFAENVCDVKVQEIIGQDKLNPEDWIAQGSIRCLPRDERAAILLPGDEIPSYKSERQRAEEVNRRVSSPPKEKYGVLSPKEKDVTTGSSGVRNTKGGTCRYSPKPQRREAERVRDKRERKDEKPRDKKSRNRDRNRAEERDRNRAEEMNRDRNRNRDRKRERKAISLHRRAESVDRNKRRRISPKRSENEERGRVSRGKADLRVNDRTRDREKRESGTHSTRSNHQGGQRRTEDTRNEQRKRPTEDGVKKRTRSPIHTPSRKPYPNTPENFSTMNTAANTPEEIR